MLQTFLLLTLVALSHQGPLVTEDQGKIATCTPGHAWVDNYIKYQCFEDEGTKGIAVVGKSLMIRIEFFSGCAPKNDMTSEVLLPWQTHTTCNFKYVCEMDSDHALYKVKTCMDRTGAVLKVGQNRTFDDGESVFCFEENGKIRLRITTKQGCIVGKAIYAEGHTWIEQTADIVKIASRSLTVSVGVSWQCKKDANGSFFSQATACLSAQNKYILPDAFGEVNGVVVKCSSTKENVWKLQLANDAEISCKNNGRLVRNAQEWTTPDGKTGYVCHYGVVIKRSCIINGVEIPLHATKYIDGRAYYCHAGDGLFNFGNLTGCNLSDGRNIRFESLYYDGEKIMKCSFNFTSYSTAVPQTEQVGCLYNKEEISKNAMQLIDGHYIYCARKGDFYIARQLTAQEIQGENSYSRLLDGVEGEGSGGQFNKPTTLAITTTTPRPTTTAKPTTTGSTSRPAPSTTAKPKTTSKPTTTSTTTATPTVLTLTTCRDYIEPELCAKLSPLCYTTAAKVREIRKLINTTIPVDQQERLNNLLIALTDDLPEEYHTQRLFGDVTEPGKESNCESCKTCAQRAGGMCALKKRVVREIVQYICPKTCGCPEGYTSHHFVSLLLKENRCKCKCC